MVNTKIVQITYHFVVASDYLARMDVMWFKKQQKRVGATAADIAERLGRHHSVVSRIYMQRQPMTLEYAKAFADVLQVPIDEVLKRAGALETHEAQPLELGFSDSDAAQYVAPSAHTQLHTKRIAQHFGGERPGVDVWQVKTSVMALQGLLVGDFIIVDTHASERVRGGETVIAQRYDHNLGAAVTMLRRFEPPVLVAASADPEDRRVHVVDGDNVVIRGKVIAAWRAEVA